MAARFSEEDGNLNTGKGGFLLNNTSNELVLNRSLEDGVDLNRESCVDHSILAIFEDSSVPSESKIHAEEDSERLLSALTEMLDRVEEDEDGTFSPFDIVPNTKLLGQTLSRDNATSQELSPSRKLRPRPKPPNESHQTKTGGEKHQESEVEGSDLPKMLEAKVEVFTSTSLISLVHLMHPYCLKLQVEKEDKLRTQSLFSQEEVWKYERPTEEGDEEINVVSEDEEAPVIRTKVGDELDKKTDKCLKSVLLNGNSPRAASSRERKRVSFGPVHVASFDESEEEGSSEKSETKSVSLNGSETPENPESSTLEIPSLISERNTFDDQQEGEKKSEMKAKSLSLQEYRKLRQNRRPLVEKQGNNTTKWPSITEPPKELTPIFCFQEQKQNVPHPDLHKPDYKTPVHCACLPIPSEVKPPPHQNHNRSKSSRTRSKMISPASPLPDDATNPNVTVLEAKKSPAKKTTLLNTDPPNPVLLPLPVPQTPSPSTAISSSESKVETVSLQSSRRLQEIQNESSAAALQTQAVLSEPKPHLLSLNKDLKLNNATLSQGIKASSTTIPPDGSPASPVQTGCKMSSDCSLSEAKGEEQLPKSPVKPTKCITPPLSQPPPLTETPIVLKEEAPHVVQTAVESGIEAPDLTSLLEQFEETQAMEDEVVHMENKLHPGTSPSSVQTESDGHVDLNKPEGPERTSRLQLKPVKPLEALSPSAKLLALQTLDPVDIPEPLCTEIVLSSQRDQPARCKNPPKSIQIIDPRPLPPKKTHTSPAESPPAHVFSYLSFDHDYCRPVDLPPGSQSSRAKSSSFTETSKVSTEPPMDTQDSKPAEGGQKHTSGEQTSEQLWTRSKALQFSGRAVMEDVDVNNIQTPPSILPTPPPSPPERGRDKRRYRRRSPRSDSSSRSSSSSSSSSCASCSPKRPRIHRSRSESSSCSSSPSSCASHSPPRRYRLSYSRSSYSRSRSRSWSRSPSRSRSPSPPTRRRWREVRSNRESRKLQREHEVRIQKLKAIDERRVVYVGRIRRTMTHNELRERFSQFGEVECVSLHFRDRGDHYGFVTFYNMEDAFAAIDNGGKLRKPDELPFDICFGGRRQFCNTNYADLDANKEAERSPTKSRFEDLDFDSLLKQAQKGQKR